MTATAHLHTQASTQIVRFQGGGLRFLDTHGFQVVTRPFQASDATQHWKVIGHDRDGCTIQQVSSGRFLAAAIDADFAVTTVCLSSDAQRWRIGDFGGGFTTIQHVDSGRFLEATVFGDFVVVTRPAGSSEQVWRIGDP
ncbi:RICIN domain-containing protein [Mycolicibacterium sp. 120270]|uniref:RICIN domain-containing protein n=1 Tax=Mycolicibacterium sp. 120270 TaxID=3090600 RepID=UPI00299E9A99|nr:RICIN domain-containing protein [Mycolicibacterium sp. 120270]MDX1882423.1 RICIN domain-containing protein [Mycolicibacterium sp. 120270]